MKCKCGKDAWPNRRVCPTCLSLWSEMRKQLFDFLENKHGKMCQLNHPLFIEETKRLERVWRKDPNKFVAEISV